MPMIDSLPLSERLNIYVLVHKRTHACARTHTHTILSLSLCHARTDIYVFMHSYVCIHTYVCIHMYSQLARHRERDRARVRETEW